MHYLALIIAIGFWIAAVVITRRQIRFLRSSTTTTATFVDWVSQRAGNSILWSARVSYITPDGMEQKCPVGFARSSKPTKPPFSTTVVRYDPAQPGMAQSASWIHLWIGSFLFFGCALMMTAIFIRELNPA